MVDEAHNLVERARTMYSADICKEDFLELKKQIKPYHTGLEKYIDRCNKELLALKKEHDENDIPEKTGAFSMALSRLHSAMSNFLEDHEESPVRKEILEFYFLAGRYLDVNERIDDNYVTYTKMEEDGRFCIRQFCVDPSTRLKECMDQGISAVLFSATFLPIQYYKRLLGGESTDYEVYAKSTFDENSSMLILSISSV